MSDDTDETPREWWLWDGIIYSDPGRANANRDFVLACNQHNPSGLTFYSSRSVTHVIEHSAYLRVKEERDALKDLVAGYERTKEIARETIAQLKETVAQLKARVAELEAALKQATKEKR